MQPQDFTREREQLLQALDGHLTQGGIVENIQPIGTCSLPDISSALGETPTDYLDIAIAVWPFPLPPAMQAALTALGYQPQPQPAPIQRFRHTERPIQLFILEPGSQWWQNALVLRDYLSYTPSARAAYLANKPKPEAPVIERDAFFSQWQIPANQWWLEHNGFAPVESVAAELQGFDRPWWIASGWALDLWQGKLSRVHHDVDVELDRHHSQALQNHLLPKGWKFVTPMEGQLEPWLPNQPLELPRHQAHAHRDGAFIDFQLSQIESGIWHFRRDPSIVRTVERAILHTPSGLPYLAPELVLLFKSRSSQDRPKDTVDFEMAYPYLEPERRAWLRWALTAYVPNHPWIEKLA